jgi:hypothetical protein
MNRTQNLVYHTCMRDDQHCLSSMLARNRVDSAQHPHPEPAIRLPARPPKTIVRLQQVTPPKVAEICFNSFERKTFHNSAINFPDAV